MPYKYSNRQLILSRILEFAGALLLKPFTWTGGNPNGAKAVTRILIAEPFQMGDVISTTVLLEPLKQKFPEAEIYILTKPGSAQVVLEDDRVKEVLVADFPWSDYGAKKAPAARWWRLLRTLWHFQKYRFEIGIDCRGDIRSQVLLLLLGCKQRIGYTNYLHSNITLTGRLLTSKLEKAPYMHRYDWNRYLLTLLGFSPEELFPIAFPTLHLPYVAAGNTGRGNNGIVMHIGGGWKYKRWPNTRWTELIERVAGQYAEHITVVGGPGEKELVEEIRSLVQPLASVTFKITSFEELVRLIHGCRLFVGLDSGPMNIANALGKRAVALFGPGDSDMWYPYRQDAVFLHKKKQFSCNPCAQKKCFYPSKNCMASIETSEVLKAVEDLSGPLGVASR